MSLYYCNKQGRFARLPALMLTELVCWFLIFTMVCIALTVVIYRQVSILDERSSAAATDERSTAKAVAMTPVMVDGALPVKSAEARPHLVCKGDSASLAETPSTTGENPVSFSHLSGSVEGHAEEYSTPSKTESRIAGVLPSHKDSRYSRYQARPTQFIYAPGRAYANPVDEYEYETRGITP